jgi:hypothetical protein
MVGRAYHAASVSLFQSVDLALCELDLLAIWQSEIREARSEAVTKLVALGYRAYRERKHYLTSK